MSNYLFHYQPIDPTTWAYLASLLAIGLFFKFNRFWSVRNLDLALLILLAPGLLLQQCGERRAKAAEAKIDALRDSSAAAESVAIPGSLTDDRDRGQRSQRLGYYWLFCVGGLLIVRLLLDPTMVRRPLLEPNLSTGGLCFIGCSLFVFLMANVVGSHAVPPPTGVAAADEANLVHRGPGNPALYRLPNIPTSPEDMVPLPPGVSPAPGENVSRWLVIVFHLIVLVGMVLIGGRHFENIRMGIGTATLYLMLPYSAIMAGQVSHILLAALLVWAIALYRHPTTTGVLIGLSVGLVHYPVYLLPLWLSFYWPRGLGRFVSGIAGGLVPCVALLFFVDGDASLASRLQHTFGILRPTQIGFSGMWSLGWDPVFRIPVWTAFLVMCITLSLWPAQKNLGTLLSCSAAVMVGTQFWHGTGGGLQMAWYLPLVLLTIFRPNLEDRVALAVLGDGWFPRRRRTDAVKIAA